MPFSIGVTGTGRFAQHFIRLFKAHPLVSEVVVADLLPERAAETLREHGLTRSFASHEALCGSDVDAVAIFAQRELHGPLAIQALEAGKHVYSAVPMALELDHIRRIVDLAGAGDRVYMMGETSYYYPSTVYCRDRFRKGDFGPFVYAEAQYLHDMVHFYESFRRTGGADWKRIAGLPPMYYPTHSTSMVLAVTGARATHVSCLGYRDRSDDGVFGHGKNQWDNPFSNESALIRTSDGGVVRVNEMRRVGWWGKNSVHMRFYGEKASFEEHGGSQVWVERDVHGSVDLSTELAIGPEQESDDFAAGYAAVHEVARLPQTFRGLPNGHLGSHHFLVDDFVRAVDGGALPPNNAWDAARYNVPGLIAHKSALMDGAMLEVPDLGAPPGRWRRLVA